MTPLLTVALFWIAFAPLGYLSARWFNRRVGLKWTRCDRLWAIVFSMLNGPLMPLAALGFAVMDALERSDWGKQDARW